MSYPYSQLWRWNQEMRLFPMGNQEPGDYHRLQIERWLWDSRIYMQAPIVDIGAEFRRDYLGGSYMTANVQRYNTGFAEVRPDILGDLRSLPFADESIGTLIATETLEHIPQFFKAVAEIRRVLRPGGTAYMSSPFIWPTHDTQNYGDFWRITEQGWRYLFAPFEAVNVQQIEMRQEARFLWHHLANWCLMGVGWECGAPTGYMVAARK